MYAAKSIQREDYRKEHRARTLRRQRERRRVVLLFILTLLVMFVIGMGFGSMITRAKEPVTKEFYKYYTNVEIQDGDTLWDLAGNYMDQEHYKNRTDYINEVMKINGMSSTNLIQGHKIILPYYSDQLL